MTEIAAHMPLPLLARIGSALLLNSLHYKAVLLRWEYSPVVGQEAQVSIPRPISQHAHKYLPNICPLFNHRGDRIKMPSIMVS